MEARRALRLMREIYIPTYPTDASDEDKFYGTPDWESTEQRVYKEIQTRLRSANLPPEKPAEKFKPADPVVIFKPESDLKDKNLSPSTVA